MNVIVICSDTFRQDHLGFLGQQKVFTPRLDQLARESATFTDFRLCSFPTITNRIEVFTGRYTFPVMDWGPLPFHFPVLAEVFKHHGFDTALVADNLHLMQEGFGFDRGFDQARDVPGQMHDHFQPDTTPMIDLPCPVDKLEPAAHRLDRYRRNAFWYRQQGTNTTETVFHEAGRWLEKPHEKFFLWIDAFDPHEPWDAPESFLQQYPWNKEGDRVIWPHSGKVDRYSAADLENMRSLYRAEVTQTDFHVGKLLDFLGARGLLENTAVIFCSDHGYYFGEHGLLGKPVKRRLERPLTIYGELGNLPLLVRHPRGVGAGQMIRGLCQPPDLFATALDFAGIPPVPWAQGKSLLARLDGKIPGQKFAVGGIHPRKGNVGCLTVWTDQWCLIYSPIKGLDGSELYHTPSDPGQVKNVIAENRPVAEEHLALLRSWLNDLGVTRARQEQLLHAAQFGWMDRMKHRFWMWRNQRLYQKNYGSYAMKRSPGTSSS
jgi:arylsulfatase A-like enzyme